MPFRSWIKDTEYLTGFSRMRSLTSISWPGFCAFKTAEIAPRPPWGLIECRGREMDQFHLFPLGWEEKKALATWGRGLETLSGWNPWMPTSPALYRIKSSEHEQSTRLVKAPLLMYAHRSPASPDCVLMLFIFWCFLKLNAKFIFLSTFYPQEALWWLGWQRPWEPSSLKWLSGIGPVWCPLFLRVFGDFDGLLKMYLQGLSQRSHEVLQRTGDMRWSVLTT